MATFLSFLIILYFSQKHHAIENNRSFAQGLEVGQQKLVSTLAVAQAQIVELRNAVIEKDRAMVQLRKEVQHSVRYYVALLTLNVNTNFFPGHGSDY
jgi:hypothetical protein